MEKLRVAVAEAAGRVARSRPVFSLRAVFGPRSDDNEAQRGQGLAEYALILAGIAIVAVASLIFLCGTITNLFWAPINEDFGKVLSMLGI